MTYPCFASCTHSPCAKGGAAAMTVSLALPPSHPRFVLTMSLPLSRSLAPSLLLCSLPPSSIATSLPPLLPFSSVVPPPRPPPPPTFIDPAHTLSASAETGTMISTAQTTRIQDSSRPHPAAPTQCRSPTRSGYLVHLVAAGAHQPPPAVPPAVLPLPCAQALGGKRR